MTRRRGTRLAVALLVLAGCGGTIQRAAYPAEWAPRVAPAPGADCADIAGTYRPGAGPQPLPFFLFGITERGSPQWLRMVEAVEQVRADPGASTVTVGFPQADRMEVVVAVRGVPIATQRLTRLRRSATLAEAWLGQDERSFRCDPDAVVIVGGFIHDWDQYRLPDPEKKRRFPRPGGMEVGTSRGYFDFSKATDGRLVMQQRLYHCYGSCSLDRLWRQWEPVPP